MKKTLILCIFILSQFINIYSQNLTKYVDPFIGTSGTAHTFPGATLPFGMVQLSPDTDTRGWAWCSGYQAADSSIIGFSHTHLSGTGAADYGDILLMPYIGNVKIEAGTKDNPDLGYRSRFQNRNEKASAGYYSVVLDDYNILVELTTTLRVGLHKYTFPKSDSANIILDLFHGISDTPVEGYVKIYDNKVEGYRYSTGWAKNQKLYFAAEFSKKFSHYNIYKDNIKADAVNEGKAKNLKANLTFSTKANEAVYVKVALSPVSVEGAWKNMKAELPNIDFEQVRTTAEKTWEKELQTIIVEGKNEDDKTKFYTALYHSMIHPNIYNDVDGKYRGMDDKIYQSDDNYYTVFSLWDTYRALHPLFTITNPEKNIEFIKTLLKKYKESDVLPVWELASNETWTMIGYHSIPVIVDAYMKGYRNFDTELALNAMMHSSELNHFGLDAYRKYGFVPTHHDIHSVSKTLEYAYDDWCIAQMAKELGRLNIYNKYNSRAKNYLNLFDGGTKFMRGRNSDSTWWATFFDPTAVTRDYTEANAWQYSFYVPHDVKGLTTLYGGKNNLLQMLDGLYSADSKLAGIKMLDITGLIGQYAHGNEPSHHIAYLYSYLGQPSTTQKLTKRIMDEFYSTERDGMSGNEDCGQMSAWYIFSAMGLYPVTPGSNQYILGAPIFNKVTINLHNNKFTITAKKLNDNNIYVKAKYLNNKPLQNNFITHNNIINGSELLFEMTDKETNTKVTEQPYSLSSKEDVVPTPYIKKEIPFFINKTTVDIASNDKDSKVYYITNNTDEYKTYNSPIEISESSLITLFAEKNGIKSIPSKYKMTKVLYRSGDKVTNLKNGVTFNYYQGDFASAYDILNAEVIDSGIIYDITISQKPQEEQFGYKYEFYYKADKKGLYHFFLNADDGGILIVDGKEIINVDGRHPAVEDVGGLALKPGYHKMTILYFEHYVDDFLQFSVIEPNGTKQKVNPKDLFYVTE